MKHTETILFLPILISINKITNNKNYGRLFFHTITLVCCIYEIINNKLFYFSELNNLLEYNYIGEKCSIIALMYFNYDIINIYKKIPYLLHHSIYIFGISYALYYNFFTKIAIYLFLHEISSIFLDLKLLNIYPEICDVLFKLNFVIIRIGSLPIITYKLYYQNKFIFILSSINCYLHVYWILNSLTFFKKPSTKIHILNKKKI
mgnify:CR=1 FL=1